MDKAEYISSLSKKLYRSKGHNIFRELQTARL